MHGVVAVFWERAPGERGELMQARIWGCRGSVAAPGPDTVKYGGNTSCVEVRLASGHALVLDAGTGMRPLGVAMQNDLPVELHVMLTHLHHGPSAGPRLLPAVVRARPRHPHLGPDVAGAAPRRAHRDVPVAAAVPGPPRRRPFAHHVPRRARRARDDRVGDDPRREGDAPGPDRRLPHRGARPHARVPSRSRAVARRRSRHAFRRRG